MTLIHVKDKFISNHSYYVPECYCVDMQLKNDKFGGFTIMTNENNISGETIDDLVVELKALISKYDLNKNTKYTKDLLIIYIDNLDKIRGWMQDYITSDCDLYIQVLNHIEFRSYSHFSKKHRETTENGLKIMTTWYKTFIAEKYFYFTPAQVVRKRIARTKLNYSEIYPENVRDYSEIMTAIHGGILYARDCDRIIPEPMLGLDITSAYIYGLVFKKHCCSALKVTETEDWDLYIGRDDKGSIGKYKITYMYPYKNIKCFKDIKGNHLKNGKNKVEIWLSSIDLNTLMSLNKFVIEEIECTKLYIFDMDYLPASFRNYCIEEFLCKQSLEKDSIAYKNQKVLLNAGFFGNLIINDPQKAFDKEYKKTKDYVKAGEAKHAAFRKQKKEANTLPQWGILTMSYCKELIMTLGAKVIGWRYSDTDSIYCDDCEKNRNVLEAFNRAIYNRNIILCDKFDYSYDVAQLGTFDTTEIKRFRCWGTKTYAYETEDGIEIKAAGCIKDDTLTAEEVFSEDFKPKAGDRILAYYDSKGYHEKPINGEVMLIASYAYNNL